MDDRRERNKAAVTAFYDLMSNQCRPAEAIEMYAGDVYTQHNPEVEGLEVKPRSSGAPISADM